MKIKQGGGNFENAPTGNHIARCYGCIDLGTQPISFQGNTTYKHKLRLMFELPTEFMEGKYDAKAKGKPYMVGGTFTASLHPKGNLRPMLVGWRGREFTKEELAGFETKKLVGAPCRLTLVQNGEYVNIASASPLARGEKCPKQINKSIYLSLEPEEFDQKTFEALSDSYKEKIKASPEYAKMFAAAQGEEPQPDPGEPSDQGEPGEPDDDMPF